jgi:hypothetical protein
LSDWIFFFFSLKSNFGKTKIWLIFVELLILFRRLKSCFSIMYLESLELRFLLLNEIIYILIKIIISLASINLVFILFNRYLIIKLHLKNFIQHILLFFFENVRRHISSLSSVQIHEPIAFLLNDFQLFVPLSEIILLIFLVHRETIDSWTLVFFLFQIV